MKNKKTLDSIVNVFDNLTLKNYSSIYSQLKNLQKYYKQINENDTFEIIENEANKQFNQFDKTIFFNGYIT